MNLKPGDWARLAHPDNGRSQCGEVTVRVLAIHPDEQVTVEWHDDDPETDVVGPLPASLFTFDEKLTARMQPPAPPPKGRVIARPTVVKLARVA